MGAEFSSEITGPPAGPGPAEKSQCKGRRTILLVYDSPDAARSSFRTQMYDFAFPRARIDHERRALRLIGGHVERQLLGCGFSITEYTLEKGLFNDAAVPECDAVVMLQHDWPVPRSIASSCLAWLAGTAGQWLSLT